MKKSKKIAISAVVLAVLACAVFFFTIWSARQAASNAVDAFNAAAEKYNSEIEPYNKAAEEIASANEELQKVLDRAKKDIDSGDEAYEPDKLDDLKKEMEEAQKLFAEVPTRIDPFDMLSVTASFNSSELAVQQQEAEASLAAVEEAELRIPEIPEVPDFSDAKKRVTEKCEAYEKSVQMLKNITCPPDSFVRERLQKIDTVVQAGAVSEENDPNGLLGKEGGYTGCVYFLDERIDRSLLPAEAFREADDEDKEESGQEEQDGEQGSDQQEQEADGSAEQSDESGTDQEASEAGTGAEAAEEAGTGKTAEAAAEATALAAEEDSTAAEEKTAENDETAPGAEESAAGETVSGTVEEGMTAAEAATGGTAAEAAAEEEPKEKIDVVMIGTAGGGAVEVFASEKDAEARLEYLAFFDGSVMAAGSYDIEGTCVIRTSKYLSEDQQKELTKKIREALLTVE